MEVGDPRRIFCVFLGCTAVSSVMESAALGMPGPLHLVLANSNSELFEYCCGLVGILHTEEDQGCVRTGFQTTVCVADIDIDAP